MMGIDPECTLSPATGAARAGNALRQADAVAKDIVAVGRFDRQAANYERHASVQRDMAAWLAQWLSQEGDADFLPHSVLDLGAGAGAFTRFLTERFTQVSALDSAVAMLEQGRRNLPYVQWLHGDAWTLVPLLPDARDFDCVASASLLQWCKTPQQTLQHWARSFRRGTRMVHGFYVEPTLCEWRSVFGDAGGLDWRNAQQWQDTFTQAGWRVLRSECAVRRYRFNSALELARSLHGTGAISAHSGGLTAGRFRALLQQYDARFAIANLPCNERLYDFGETPAQEDRSQKGVYASWAFFRIEAELA